MHSTLLLRLMAIKLLMPASRAFLMPGMWGATAGARGIRSGGVRDLFAPHLKRLQGYVFSSPIESLQNEVRESIAVAPLETGSPN
jgi:hypothetical protein